MIPPETRTVTLAARVYRALLVAYPPGFRQVYGPPMVQLFHDCCRDARRRAGWRGLGRLWLATLGDLARSGLRERVAASRATLDATERSATMAKESPRLRAAGFGAALLAGLIGCYVNLHTDETSISAFSLLGLAAIVSFAFPRRAWRWVPCIVIPIPLGQWLAFRAGLHLPYTDNDVVGALIGALLFVAAGTGLGVLGRWVLRQLRDTARET